MHFLRIKPSTCRECLFQSIYFAGGRFFPQKMVKKLILINVWSAQHPNAGQNKQHMFLYFQILTYKMTIQTEKQFEEKPQPQQQQQQQHSCGSRFLKKLCSKTVQGTAWLWKDLKQPHLFWVKVIFMLQSASLVTLYPYLIVHLR